MRLKGTATPEDAARFTGHMIMESARMSIEDGLVMQLHTGSLRNHNPLVYERFGPDKGADIPVATEWTHALQLKLLTTRTQLVLGEDEAEPGRATPPIRRGKFLWPYGSPH